MLASLVLREGLAAGADAQDIVMAALDVAAVGVAGAVLCVVAHERARKLAKTSGDDADLLVERLERFFREPSASRAVEEEDRRAEDRPRREP